MVLNAVLLYLLAVCDSALSGYRAVTGLNPQIFKRDYHRQAVLRALVWGHGCIALIVALILLLLLLSKQPQTLVVIFTKASGYCLEVYLAYAALTLIALIFFTAPSRDVRSLSIVLILGPFTLIRLPVAIIGAAWAFWHQPNLEVLIVCVFALTVMLRLEIFLWRKQLPQVQHFTEIR